jgi:hypothetical protein
MLRLGYLIALLLFVAAVSVGFSTGHKAVSRAKEINTSLEQFAGPGTLSLKVTHPGTQTIYLETSTSFQGKAYNTPSVAGLKFAVTDPAGQPVATHGPASINYTVGSRSGHSVAAFDAPEAGTYPIVISADTPAPFVVAIGNFGVGKLVSTVLGGIGKVIGLFFAALATAILTFVLRRRQGGSEQPLGPAQTPEYIAR